MGPIAKSHSQPRPFPGRLDVIENRPSAGGLHHIDTRIKTRIGKRTSTHSSKCYTVDLGCSSSQSMQHQLDQWSLGNIQSSCMLIHPFHCMLSV